MRIETLVIVQRDSKVLLGLKHSGKKFGGKWNGFGGGLEIGETLEECARREMLSETGATPKNLLKLGIINFHFPTDEQNHEVHIYQANDYEGKLNTLRDFIEYREFTLRELEKISHQMMPADKYWLSIFIEKGCFRGEVYFDKEMKNPKVNIYRVENLD
ncbi:MAG: NUDIX domain-containing protein [Nanoarchaeota archaeon]|nr:NUDIX domain-containing protein [Nanoarchaeota archaeon]